MSNITTDPNLLAALKKTAGRSMTAKEIREQRISFVMGAVGKGGEVSRAEVEKIIDQREGCAA